MMTTEVDGVPVFWLQGPEPLSAGLVFGVGRRDETFAAGGLTHLVEHLTMGALPKRHVDRNASVSTSLTEFTVTGGPEQVVEFLAGVCSALSALPMDRLATERRVLAAEAATSGGGSLAALLLARYGATGPGLVGMVEPAVGSLTGEQVEEHARLFFHRRNAALWLTGPPPDGLRLPLPDGAPPVRAPVRRVPLVLPTQRPAGSDEVAMSLEGPASEQLYAVTRIARERMEEELRHGGGHTYCVELVVNAIDPTSEHVALFADAAPKEVVSVARGMHDVLRALSTDGPTQDEVGSEVEAMRAVGADVRSAEPEVSERAGCAVLGHPWVSFSDRIAAVEASSPDDLARALREALPSLLVHVPEDAPPVLPEVPVAPEGSTSVVTGREVKRRLRSDVPRGARLVVGPEGVTLRWTAEQWLTVTYADCVAVGVTEADHRHLDLVDLDGRTLELCEQDWKDGPAVLGEVERATRAVPRFTVAVPDEAA